ncbi:MAG TPA: hypothetical protein VNO55_11360 [Polyangia bacterium]|nr:hypothetical protein [Polyangia bacterium]
MTNERGDDFDECLECGAVISTLGDRGFAVGAEDIICMECALRRGGSYDENQDRWVTPPRIDDLLKSIDDGVHADGP